MAMVGISFSEGGTGFVNRYSQVISNGEYANELQATWNGYNNIVAAVVFPIV